MTSVSGVGPEAERVTLVPPSCLHAVFRSVEAYEETSRKAVIRLHVGEPSYAPPSEAVEALADAVCSGRAAYSSAEGLPALRTALARKLAQKNQIHTSDSTIMVSVGSTQGLFALMQSLHVDRAEMLLPAIHWPIHLQQCLLTGFRPAFYPLRADFGLDPEAVESASTPRTRVLLINTPSNPTGVVLDRRVLEALLAIAHRRGWYVISDEAYEDFAYARPHVSIAALEQHLAERERRVFSVFTFSKSYAMTGYRLGYVAAPHQEAALRLRVVQEASILSPATPVQLAGLAALGASAVVERAYRQLLGVRDHILPALVHEGALDSLPQGGWYALVDLGRFGIPADRFAHALLHRGGVAAAPAAGFALRPVLSADGGLASCAPDPSAAYLLRIAFCGDPGAVEEGISRLRAFLRESAH